MESLRQHFSVEYNYQVHFTEQVFDINNTLLANVLTEFNLFNNSRLLFVADEGAHQHHPGLFRQIKDYFASREGDGPRVCEELLVIPGGEQAKNDPAHLQRILAALNEHKVDRHSFLIAIGGGAVLDVAGYAAAIAHRGVRHIRIPTTVLAQNDSGVGVKNGVNFFGKKNFLGTFQPPVAVINDFAFLKTLTDRDWRAGIAEAVKVALIKDPAFFGFLEQNAGSLYARDMQVMKELIRRCAALHLEHIRSGDPFEQGSSRPLDFGHWAAHKLEQMTLYQLRHGEAVIIGMALDVVYSTLTGRLAQEDGARVLSLLQRLGFRFYDPVLNSNLDPENRGQSVLAGLQEFREHLGGQLTVMLLESIGKGTEVHEIDEDTVIKSIQFLRGASVQDQMNVTC